ncbi:methionine ABC transporter ATP-binding protein [Effusibacillus dendaii]|uniref:Methionine import ATP-binding protein MetN n=1 Tax=Effusibacillus dendaii TaxID=2743772 RepID=A0A7I8D955_9BACL|nr:methionine ABC transporter ATP-binding protein [Effusibacillus dendaii]BCJ85529.1 methionine import ATP-binding protein MetN [Effusibacillus dendaii]
MIELVDLYKEYQTKRGKVIAVNHVSLKIEPGEIFGIVGYSGAGKSSLLRCMNLLERPTTGVVRLNDVDLTTLNTQELRQARQKIGMIFQHFNLNSSRTVFQNVAFALKAANKSKDFIEKRVPELLALVGLADKADQYPSQLSGGQKQRVGIARALANDPHVLLCDEATSALDPKTTKSILALLKEINEKLGLTIVLITHEMEVIKEICHRVAVMKEGDIIEVGNVYDIFANPKQSLTREFIETVLHFELPSEVLQHRNPHGILVKIQFKGEIAEESIVSDVLQSCKVKGNILHGKIEYIQNVPLGIFIMELSGDSQEVDKALGLLRERTSELEVIADVLK